MTTLKVKVRNDEFDYVVEVAPIWAKHDEWNCWNPSAFICADFWKRAGGIIPEEGKVIRCEVAVLPSKKAKR